MTEDILCFLRSTHKLQDYKFVRFLAKEMAFTKILSRLDENSQMILGSLEDEFQKLIGQTDAIDKGQLKTALSAELFAMITELSLDLQKMLEQISHYKLHLRNFFIFLNT